MNSLGKELIIDIDLISLYGFLSWQNKTKNSNRPKTEDFSKHLIAWILFRLVTESTGLSWIEGTISVYSQELSKIFLIHNIDHFVKKSIPLRQPSLQGVEVYSHFVMCIQRRDTCWFRGAISPVLCLREHGFSLYLNNTVLSHQGRKRL